MEKINCSLLIAVDYIDASSAMIENQEGIVAFNEYHVAAVKLPNLFCFCKQYIAIILLLV